MKNYPIILFIVFLGFAVGCAVPQPNQNNFPPVPISLTNIPTIGKPIIEDPNHLIDNEGGSNATDFAATYIGDILFKSGRFALADSTNYDCECQVSLTDLEIKTWTLRGYQNIPAILTNSAFALMSVRCGVSMRILGLHSHHYIGIGDGQVFCISNLQNLSRRFGITSTNNGVTASEISARVIQRASCNALKDMLPQLDPYLLNHQTSGKY